MKLTINDGLRQKLIHEFISNTTSLHIRLFNDPSPAAISVNTVEPSGEILSSPLPLTVQTNSIFYAILAEDVGYTKPIDSIEIELNGVKYFIKHQDDFLPGDSALFNGIYINALLKNNSTSNIDYNMIVLEATGNYDGAGSYILSIGYNSRGQLQVGNDRTFAIFIPMFGGNN